jgi:thiamine pyrophosphokinase
MTALIIAHGELPSTALLEELAADADLVVATDGAANAIIPRGIQPRVVLGDFDSLESAIREQYPHLEYVTAANQEASDLDKAVAHALERGAVRIRIAGAGGGRMDHALANASLLLKYQNAAEITLVDDRGVTCVVSEEVEFLGEPGDTLSLVPFEPVVIGSTEGLKWPLKDEYLYPGSRGVSNLFVGHVARITILSGMAFACHLRNPDRIPP